MLPKTAEYALRATVMLAMAQHERLTADRLCEQTKVPRRYLHTVLQQLAAAKLIDSVSGPRGGYRLACDPAETTILDVVNAVAPVERIHSCPLGIPGHARLCPLHRTLDDSYRQIETSLGRVTISQLLSSTGDPVPLCPSSV